MGVVVRLARQHEYPLEAWHAGQGGVMKLLECPGKRQEHLCFFHAATTTEVRPTLTILWPEDANVLARHTN